MTTDLISSQAIEGINKLYDTAVALRDDVHAVLPGQFQEVDFSPNAFRAYKFGYGAEIKSANLQTPEEILTRFRTLFNELAALPPTELEFMYKSLESVGLTYDVAFQKISEAYETPPLLDIRNIMELVVGGLSSMTDDSEDNIIMRCFYIEASSFAKKVFQLSTMHVYDPDHESTRQQYDDVISRVPQLKALYERIGDNGIAVMNHVLADREPSNAGQIANLREQGFPDDFIEPELEKFSRENAIIEAFKTGERTIATVIDEIESGDISAMYSACQQLVQLSGVWLLSDGSYSLSISLDPDGGVKSAENIGLELDQRTIN